MKGDKMEAHIYSIEGCKVVSQQVELQAFYIKIDQDCKTLFKPEKKLF